MTDTEATEQAADRTEKVAKRLAMPRPAEGSDGEGVVAPGTPPGRAPTVEKSRQVEMQSLYSLYSYRDPRASTTAARHSTCPRALPGSVPGTDRASGAYSACEGGTGVL